MVYNIAMRLVLSANSGAIFHWLHCTPPQSVAMIVVETFVLLWRSTKEVKIICPARFVLDAKGTGKERGMAAEVCRPHTGL